MGVRFRSSSRRISHRFHIIFNTNSRNMEESKKSPVDKLFTEIMGFCPNKSGTAYELLSTAAISLVLNKGAKHNQFLSGEEEETPFQIDGLIENKYMVEAKDYTIRNAKVGRDDLQKMEGALTALPQIEEGYFASATDFTKPASEYAESTEKNDRQTEIKTVNVRPSTKEDLKGRIQTIAINLEISYPDYSQTNTGFVFSNVEKRRMMQFIKKEYSEGEHTINTSMLYDENGREYLPVSEIFVKYKPHYSKEDKRISGIIPIDAYVRIKNELFKIDGVEYKDVPIITETETLYLKPQGEAKILIESKKLGINKLITDKEIKSQVEKIIENSKE